METRLGAPEAQVFRDDSGLRWRRVRGALGALAVASSAVGALLLLGLIPGAASPSAAQSAGALASFDARLAHRPHKGSPALKDDEAHRTQSFRLSHIDPWHRTAERDAKLSGEWASHVALVTRYDQLAKALPSWVSTLNRPLWLNLVASADDPEELDWARVRAAADTMGAGGIELSLCDAKLATDARKTTKRPIAIRCSPSRARGAIGGADFVFASLEQFDPPWLQNCQFAPPCSHPICRVMQPEERVERPV